MTDQQTVKGQRPPPTAGMRHVALFVSDFKAACFFYIELLGMAIEWQPDEDNIFFARVMTMWLCIISPITSISIRLFNS